MAKSRWMVRKAWLLAFLLFASAAVLTQGRSEETAPEVAWDDCLACHDVPGADLPRLADLRTAGVGAMLKRDCLECHTRAALTESSGIWLHSTRPLAAHVSCTVCHPAGPHGADSPPRPARWGEVAEEQCLACHRTVGLDLAQQYAHGFTPGVRCRDCHSAHEPLRAAIPLPLLSNDVADLRGTNYGWQESNRQCLRCHGEAQLTLSLSSGFVTLNTVNYHDLHLVRGNAMCIECHDPHGSLRPGMLRQSLLTGETFGFLPSIDGGTCAVTCHGVQHDSWTYRNKVY